MATDFEKSMYKELFDRFSNGEYHHTYLRSECDDFETIRSSADALESRGVLYILYRGDNELEVELTENYCFKYKEI